MAYQITMPAIDGYPEETFTVEQNRKPDALKEVVESLYPPPKGEAPSKELKAKWSFLKKQAVCVKLKPPKQSEWRTCELCPDENNQVLRSDLVEHVRGFHMVGKEIEA